ncbi:MAG: protein kinase, partial [Oligoflexales bacterium]|nr:protein kinase [Oligoflexales bacterium]
KVTDFGIADAESKETETKPGIVKGKYSYMGPEQITAQAVDARTDVFALGIILWESLAMRRLFHAENEIEIIQMVRNCKISYDIATLNPEVDEQLQQILSKALAKNPDDRYSSAAAFEKDLRYYINQHYADFTTQDLALFMKRLLNKRKEEVAKDIKELLSQAIAESAKTSPPIEQKKETPKVSPQVAAAVKAPLKTETPGTGIKQGAFSLDKNNYGNRAGSWSGPAYTNAHKTRVNSAWDAKSSPSSSSSFAKFVFFVIAMVGIFLGGFYYYQKTQSGKEPGNLNLSTIPDTVLLTLDDLALFEGKYINTPIALKRIPIGRHLLKITRVGFAEEVLDIDIRGGETLTRNNIVLKATTQMAPVRVFLEPGSKQGLKINIADGLIETNVSPSDPLNLDSLPFGQIYNLRVYPDLSDNSRYFDCRFVPRAQNWKAPYLVMIEPGRQKCSFPLR